MLYSLLGKNQLEKGEILVMLKLELTIILKELFALGGNHDPEKALGVRKKLVGFINEEELYLKREYSEDFETAKAAIYLIDAMNVYATTSDRVEGYLHMKPFFERLIQFEIWGYYDLHLFISSINFIVKIEDAIELSSKALKAMENFKDAHNTAVMEGVLACNMCSRLLYAKYFDESSKVDLAEHFNRWFSRLEPLVEINYELSLPFLATEIRQALFNQDDKQLQELCKDLHEGYDEDVESAITNEISFHTNSPKYKALQEKAS